MPKKTPWFPFTTPPVRPGVYNVSCRHKYQTGRWYARFDGELWSFWCHSSCGQGQAIKEASEAPLFRKTPNGTWRGLTKEAK